MPVKRVALKGRVRRNWNGSVHRPNHVHKKHKKVVRWTELEDAIVVQNLREGRTVKSFARLLPGRTVQAIYIRINKLGLAENRKEKGPAPKLVHRDVKLRKELDEGMVLLAAMEGVSLTKWITDAVISKIIANAEDMNAAGEEIDELPRRLERFVTKRLHARNASNALPVKPKRGRPKGSKNKPKVAPEAEASEE